MLLDLAIILIAYRLGRPFLYAAIVGNIMFTNMVSSNIVTTFGFAGTVANVFYAAIFLGTDLISEHWGKKYAYKAIWMGFFALMLIVIFGPLVQMFTPVEYSMKESDALSVIFGRTARIAVASIIAYLIANTFDVWWYDVLQRKFSTIKTLYIRNIGSTVVSQLIDNTLFVVLAFAGAVPTNVLWQIWLAGYVIKIIVAMADTPFMYLSHWIKPTSQKWLDGN